MRDPALVEQIGPRQYRLRVYPVPAVRTQWDPDRGRTEVDEAPPLYLWMTYQVMARNGGWPLPQLAVKRNVYWDADTVREAGGVSLRVEEDDWLPDQVPVSGLAAPMAHRFDLPGAQSVVALPVTQVELSPLPQDLRLAVVLDRSRSMAVHTAEVGRALERLRQQAGPEAAIDLFLTASEFRGEEPERVGLEGFDPQSVVYFGGQNAAELLIQFEALREDRPYDAVLVFTDGSGYELGAAETPVPLPPAPVWMVHLGEDLPLGYDDDTLEAIQASGGGVVGDLSEALTRLAVGLSAGMQGRDVLDGYVWMVVPTAEAGVAQAEPAGFGPFAARRLILAETQRQRETLGQLETLDRLHALAQEYGVVTPFSSMIVLVEDDQRRLLERLSQAGDRFQREVEALAETTPGSPLPLTGVPEPHEWLLIGLAVAMLVWYANQQRRLRSASPA
jgi:putative PEP-CTERM system integral membrane protein